MTDDSLDEETVIVSRRDRRRAVAQTAAGEQADTARAGAAQADATRTDADAHVDDTEATVVIGRSRPAASDVDEATIVVDRSRPASPVDDQEATIVVDRSRPASSVEDHESTVVVDRGRPAAFEVDEATIVVDRSGGTAVAPSGLEETIVRPRRGLRRRRSTVFDEPSPLEATIPRGPVSFERPTEPEPPAIYKPRPAPLAPQAPPAIASGPAPTRVENPALPSVTRQGIRRSRAALLAFAGACAVSVAGLVTLGFVVFG